MRKTDAQTWQLVELVCSFCTKTQTDVRKLIAGPSVFICDECVEVCRTIIANDVRQMTEDEGVSETPVSGPTDVAGMPTRCALCYSPITSGDGLVVLNRGIVCFGCLGEVEAALEQHRIDHGRG